MPDYNTPATWQAGTSLTLARVGWDRWNVPHFASAEARDAWFDAKAAAEAWPSWTNSRFLRVGEPVTVDLPYSLAYTFNYLVVDNPPELGGAGGRPSKLFYFVESVRPTSRGGCELTIDLDVWTTRIHGVHFGRGYVAKGHALMADSRASYAGDDSSLPAKLREWYTLPEGLDAGAEMVEVSKEFVHLDDPYTTQGYVLIVSTADLEPSPGTVDKPNMTCAKGDQFDGLAGGCTVYAVESRYFRSFMDRASAYPWVTQNIVAIYTMPSAAVDIDASHPVGFFGWQPSGNDSPGNVGYRLESSALVQTVGTVDLDNLAVFPAGQGWAADLLKMRAAPYSAVVLENGAGQSVALKPQLMPYTQTDLKFIGCAMWPFMRCGVFPEWYGAQTADYYGYVYRSIDGAKQANVPAGDFLDTALWLADFPSFSIVNNNYISVVAGQANAAAARRQTAQIGRDFAGEQAAIAQTQAERAVSTEGANLQLGQDAQLVNAGIGGAASIARGVGFGFAGGGIGGAVAGGISGAVSTATDFATTLVSQEAERSQAENRWAQAFANVGENNTLAMRAASISYEADMRALNAGLADAALTPPGISGQAGGDGLALKMGRAFTVTVRYMRIAPQAVETVGTIWKRYGYATNRYADLSSCPMSLMSVCTYWQLSEVFIDSADMDEGEKVALRGMLNRGLTVWANPDRIGLDDIKTNVPVWGGVIFD